MEKEKLTPAQFVERWLPDYEDRLREWVGPHGTPYHTEERFARRNFREALAAFEAHIRQEAISEVAERMSDHGIDMNSKWAMRLWQQACEAQRIECAKAYMSPECDYYNDDEEAELMILNAPIPEIPKNNEK